MSAKGEFYNYYFDFFDKFGTETGKDWQKFNFCIRFWEMKSLPILIPFQFIFFILIFVSFFNFGFWFKTFQNLRLLPISVVLNIQKYWKSLIFDSFWKVLNNWKFPICQKHWFLVWKSNWIFRFFTNPYVWLRPKKNLPPLTIPPFLESAIK